MKDKKVCPHCGAKMVEYKFTFNKGLARCLWLMRNHKDGVEIKNLKMTSSMWTNFQKLNYWHLIEPVSGENKRKGGYWKLTNNGSLFLSGDIGVFSKVVTYRNKVLRYEGEQVFFKSVSSGYLYNIARGRIC